MKPETISGAFRYSNYPDYTVSGVFQEIPGSNDYSNLSEAPSTPAGSSSSGFDWGNFFSNLFSSATSITTSIWGHNNQWQTQAYNTMYQQERRTNTILWVVIGLVVALGLFLVIRKTK